MATTICGNRIDFGADNDSVILNCPIKRILAAGSTTTTFNIFIDDNVVTLSVNSGREVEFPSLNGYPGHKITAAKACSLYITEIGDVLNPNYFKEDIRNWNGQGTASSVSEVSKARSCIKKAKVTE